MKVYFLTRRFFFLFFLITLYFVEFFQHSKLYPLVESTLLVLLDDTDRDVRFMSECSRLNVPKKSAAARLSPSPPPPHDDDVDEDEDDESVSHEDSKTTIDGAFEESLTESVESTTTAYDASWVSATAEIDDQSVPSLTESTTKTTIMDNTW